MNHSLRRFLGSNPFKVPHFYVPQKNHKGPAFFFDPQESHHLAKVLRKKSGDAVEIFDGKGAVYTAKILDCSNPDRVTGEIVPSKPSSRLQENNKNNSLSLKIYPALIKGNRFEWLLEKLTELGTESITPLITQRTLIQIRPEQTKKKIDRWKNIILSASKQSGRSRLPEISSPSPLDAVLKEADPRDLNLLLWEGEEKVTLSQSLRKWISSASSGRPLTVRLLVGPEGGFALEETRKAIESGFTSVQLGKTILRAETASIAAASIILFESVR